MNEHLRFAAIGLCWAASACTGGRSGADTTRLDSIDGDSVPMPAAEQTSSPVPAGTPGGTRSAGGASDPVFRSGDSVRMPADTQGLSRDTLTAAEMIKRRPPERRLPPPPIKP